MGMGSMVAGDCHVTDSNFQVLRAVWRRMNRRGRRNPTLRSLRKEIYREALAAHAANLELFYALAKGDIG